MKIYIAGDGDGIGQLVGRARLADDEETMRRLSRTLTDGNDLWKKWAESHGGSMIEAGGDEFCCEVSADWVGEVGDIKRQYEELVGATLSVGVGLKISEAAKALLAAKLRGKDQVVFYTQDVERQVAETKEQAEREKISDEYLLNKGGEAQVSPATPQVQPDHEEGQVAQDAFSDSSPPEATHAARDYERELHDEAWKGAKDDQKNADDRSAKLQAAKAQVAKVLQYVKQQAPQFEQLQQQAPEAYQAFVGLTQAVIGLAREIQPAPMQKAEEEVTCGCGKFVSKDGNTVCADCAKLDKAALPATHHLNLPVGSVLNGRVKTRHADGTAGWHSVRSGQILAQDREGVGGGVSGHAVSSREPNAK